jgi:transposase
MCVIGTFGVLGFELRRGPYNGQLLIEFLTTKLLFYLREKTNTILVLDNSKFIHSRVVIDFLRVNNINFKFLPPYSPQFNRIEEFFQC